MEHEEDFVGTIEDVSDDAGRSGDSEGSEDERLDVDASFFDGVFGSGGTTGGSKQHAWDLTTAIKAAAPLEGYRTSVTDKIAAKRAQAKTDRRAREDESEDSSEEEAEDLEAEDSSKDEEHATENGPLEHNVAAPSDEEDEADADSDDDEADVEDGTGGDEEQESKGSSADDDDEDNNSKEEEEEESRNQIKQKDKGQPASKQAKHTTLQDGSDETGLADTVRVKKERSRGPSEKLKSFDALPLSRALKKAIEMLEWEHATPIQTKTIPPALAGRDVCGSAVTGSGKTAAFVLPVLERILQGSSRRNVATRVLILLPTRELAVQCQAVVTSLSRFTSIRTGLVVGGLSNKTQEAAIRARPDILVATPGRLIDHVRNAQGFSLDDIEILILDEADRLLEMGFRDEVEEIVRLCPAARQTLLFSATMTHQVQWLVKLSLRNALKVAVDPKFDVAETLTQEFVRLREKTETNRDATLLALVTRNFKTKTIIFFAQKHIAHRFRVLFGLAGLNAGELHGNLTQAQRLTALQDFRDEKIDFLLCTDLAARGLDIIGVHTVINYEMPRTLTEYVHRVGRTARAGKHGVAVSIVGERERKLLREIHRKAKDQLSSRKIASKVLDMWRKKIDSLQNDIEDILKEERREKEIRTADEEIKRAENLLNHQAEIMSRPKRTWFQSQDARAETKKRAREQATGRTEEDPPKKRTRTDRKRKKLAESRERAREEQRKTVQRERTLAKMLAKRARKQEQKKRRDGDNATAVKLPTGGPKKRKRKAA